MSYEKQFRLSKKNEDGKSKKKEKEVK